MNSLIKRKYIVFLIIAVFCLPVVSSADDLDQQIQTIVKDFEQQINNAGRDQAYFIVVRSFFDEIKNKPSRRSEEIRNKTFQIIRNRYLGKSKIVILNWRSEKPFEKKASFKADEIVYKQGALQKQLIENFGIGFLITGTIATAAENDVINAELIDMKSGKVLMSSKKAIPFGVREAAVGQEAAPPKQSGAKKAVPATQTQPSKQAAAVAPAEEALPAEVKAASEVPQKDLEFKVIEGANFKYEGYVKNGLKHGQGTLRFKSGDKYVGQWRNDKKHGQGTYIFAAGDKYVGQWQDNKMHGQGTYFFKSGNKYVGRWRNDKKHGQGTYHYKNGDKWEGTYVNDKKHGYGVYYWVSGELTKEYWQDGKLVE